MKRIGLLFGMVSLLAACGGGGGSSAPIAAPATVTFPINAAVTSFFTSTHNFTSTYTDPANNDAYTLAYGYTPGADAVFESKAAKTANFTLNLKKNGVQQTTTSEVSYFQISPFKSLGSILGTGEYTVASSQVVLPESGKVGDLGNLQTSTSYTNSSKVTAYATATVTWELQADTANTAYFCVNNSTKLTNGSTAVGSECYKIDTNGNVIGNKLTLGLNGKTIVFTN